MKSPEAGLSPYSQGMQMVQNILCGAMGTARAAHNVFTEVVNVKGNTSQYASSVAI